MKPEPDLRERGPLIGRMWGLPLYGPVERKPRDDEKALDR